MSNQSEPLPPAGDSKRAEKYISSLINLLDQNQLSPSHTDLSKFDPTSLQDHYRLDLKDYTIEVSHSKNPDSGQDSYVLVFTNIKNYSENCQKIILAYMHLEPNQFVRFKAAAQESLDRKKIKEEEARLNEVLQPIDQTLDEMLNLTTKPKTFSDYSLDLTS